MTGGIERETSEHAPSHASSQTPLMKPPDKRATAHPRIGSAAVTRDTKAPSPKGPLRWQVDLGESPPAGLLPLCWAVVIAQYANTPDVQFRYVAEPSSGRSTLHRFRARVMPDQRVDAALKAASDDEDPSSPADDSVTGDGTLFVIRHETSLRDDAAYRTDYGARGVVAICPRSAQHVTVQVSFDDQPPSSLHVYMMASQLVHALRTASQRRPGQISVGDLQEISPEGLRQIAEWQPDITSEQPTVYAHQLVAEWVQQQPHAPAICAWDGELTYRELDTRAAAVAAQIRAADPAGEQAILGLFFEKSLWTVVALLGALKAGRGFILLQPSLPVQRLKAMCQRLDVQTVLSLPQFQPAVQALGVTTMLLAVRPDAPRAAGPAEDEVDRAPHPNPILHAGFTSGSTGESKIYTVSHASFCSGLDGWRRAMAVDPRTRVFHSAPYSFVLSIIEQLAPLCLGACVCIPSEDALRNDVGAAMRSLSTNWAVVTPGVARLLSPEAIPDVRALALVGEPVAQADVHRWQGHLDLRVFYGQSEVAMGTSVTDLADLAADHRNIGRPHSCRGWIVDPDNHHRLVPPGVEGELLLEGPCVSPGYLHDPDQTRAAFVQNPAWLPRHRLTPMAEGRFFKTGDLVCYDLQRGCFQYRGRKGSQVQIRGQRVELGEIEHHARHRVSSWDGAPVAEIIRPADTPEDMDPILVLFVTAPPPSAVDHVRPDATTLPTVLPPSPAFWEESQAALAHLREILPAYMVPVAVIRLSHTPQTTSGKLARRILRELGTRLVRREILAFGAGPKPYCPPSTAREQVLQRLCATLLRYAPEQVGMQDTFFDLGGDSLTARHLVQAARREGFILRAEDVFLNLPLASLAARCQDDMPRAPPEVVQLDQHTATVVQDFCRDHPDLALGPQVESVVPTHDTIAVLGNQNAVQHFILTVSGRLDRDRLQAACQALVASHAALRSVFLAYREEIMMVTWRQVAAAYRVVQVPEGEDPAAFASRLCWEDGRQSPLGPDPVVAFTVLEASADSHLLIIRLAEAQCDWPSFKTMMAQLVQLYDGGSVPVSVAYPEYLDYCRRRRTPAAFAFWRNVLHGATPLYLDGLWPDLTVLGKDSCREHSPMTMYARTIPPVCPRPGFTLATTVKVAWSYVLHQEGGWEDVVFGQVRSCRMVDLPGMDTVVGPCINLTPVRVTYAPAWGVDELLQAVQDQHVQSMPFETIGWRDLVAHCTDWPSTASLQTVVVHQGGEQLIDGQSRDGIQWCSLDGYASTILGRLFVATTVTSSGLRVELAVSRGALESPRANRLLDRLGSALEKFAAC